MALSTNTAWSIHVTEITVLKILVLDFLHVRYFIGLPVDNELNQVTLQEVIMQDDTLFPSFVSISNQLTHLHLSIRNSWLHGIDQLLCSWK